jgi:hypothetical protein
LEANAVSVAEGTTFDAAVAVNDKIVWVEVGIVEA